MSITFCEIILLNTTFSPIAQYDIAVSNKIMRNIHCDVTIWYNNGMGTYHDVIIHTADIVSILICYALLHSIMILMFSY